MSSKFHIVALPYPSKSHINAMLNLCKILGSRNQQILITFVTTEERVGSDPGIESGNFWVIQMGNVIPSDVVQVADFDAFLDAVLTKMEAPFLEVLDRIQPPVDLILTDTLLHWAVGVGNRRNIPVASFFPMSSMMFSIFHHFHLFATNGHYQADFSERGDELVDYIPGVSATSLKNFPPIVFGGSENIVNGITEAFSWLTKAQYLLLSTFYELEPHTVDTLRSNISLPIYTVGPPIPHLNLQQDYPSPPYLKWLDAQPNNSVVYISMGSFLSFCSTQMDEMALALNESGVKFMWVAREEAPKVQEKCGGNGLVVEWCEQLRVLCHPSVGAFWSHCGWNSVLEGIYGGVPFLTYPIAADQVFNSKVIVEDWKIGCRVKQSESLVKKEEIVKILGSMLDLGNEEAKEMRERAKQLQQQCYKAIAAGGSSVSDINNFIQHVLLH